MLIYSPCESGENVEFVLDFVSNICLRDKSMCKSESSCVRGESVELTNRNLLCKGQAKRGKKRRRHRYQPNALNGKYVRQ